MTDADNLNPAPPQKDEIESPFLTKADLETHHSFAVTQPLPPNPDPEFLQTVKEKLLQHMAQADEFYRADMDTAHARMAEVDNLLAASKQPEAQKPGMEPEI